VTLRGKGIGPRGDCIIDQLRLKTFLGSGNGYKMKKD